MAKVGISREYNIFELQKALINKDWLQAAKISNYFQANPKKNPGIPIVAFLYSFFSKVLAAHSVGDRSSQGLTSALKISPYAAKDYLTALQQYPQPKTLEIISLLRSADLKLKGVNVGSEDEGQILKELGLGVDDENGAGGVQAIGEDETVLDTRLPHDVPHLPRDVDGLSAPLALHGKALPPHLHPRGFGQGSAHRFALLFRERTREDGLELQHVHRLSQIGEGTLLGGIAQMVEVPVRGEENDGQGRLLIMERVQELEPVHGGHDEVRDHRARVHLGDLLESGPPVRGRLDLVAPGGEQGSQPFQ